MSKFEILTTPLKAMHQLMMMIARVIDAILRFLFGSNAPSLASRLPQLSTTPEDVIDAYNETKAALTDRAHKMASNVGLAIHTYACAKEPLVRAAVDLSGLSIEQQDWLMSLSDDDLDRLAKAGEIACDRAAIGKRCGIVGLSRPAEPAPQPVTIAPEIVSVPRFDKNIAGRVKAHHMMRKSQGKFERA